MRKLCRVPPGPGRTAALLRLRESELFLPRRTRRQRLLGACRERKSAGFPAVPDWNPAVLAGIRLPPVKSLYRVGVPTRQAAFLPRRAVHWCA